jgi:hypothetical protein
MITGMGTTVTGKLPELIPGVVVLAVIVAEPAATPLTSTPGLELALALITTLGGAVATAGLLDTRVTDRPPAGAGAERRTLILCPPAAPTVTT